MVGKVLQHRNNIMRIRALIPRFRSLIRLMLLHCAQMIITRLCPYSSRFSSLTQSTEPAQNEALLQ
ncbi:hypothetical protein T09_10005 [Trichinella sp. T9]|nr:hypothetical protein T09_11052 [Trichinella sp. T9]KRX32767.1 hypothetical protein T09_10005 [Trichinella sp. T9]